MYNKGCHPPLGNRFTNLCPGIKCGSRTGSMTLWPPIGRAHILVLTTPIAVKIAGVTPWIHYTRVKRTYHADLEDAEWTAQKDPTDPHETKIILIKKKRKNEALLSTPATWTFLYHLGTNHNFNTKHFYLMAHSYANFHNTSVRFVGQCLYQ